MPKSKKRKTNHHHHHHQNQQQPSKNGALSHAEIWDDSALIRSWNEAVSEYEFYHSIHARGEDVDEILRRAVEAEHGEMVGDEDEVDDDGVDVEDGEVQEDDNDHDHLGTTGAAIVARVEQDEAVDDNQLVGQRDLASTHVGSGAGERETVDKFKGDSVRKSTQMHAHLDYQAPTNQAVAGQASVDGEVASQTLENLKMAYYWAGYYSGLYDGQRQVQSRSQNGADGAL